MSFDSGLWLPFGMRPLAGTSIGGGSVTLDLTGEYVATVGRIAIQGKGTSKTLDTTGSSAIRFGLSGGPVFDNASSVYTVGFQGVDKTTGFPVRPDGTWGARAVITTAANTTPAMTNAATSHLIVPTAGTNTFSHGDEVMFVQEFTTRAGSDSVVPVLTSGGLTTQYPGSVTNVSGSVAGTSGVQFIEITFSDGTLGTIDGTFQAVGANLTWANASNPDEYGMIFQAPWGCKIDAIAFPIRIVDATSDLQFDITSDPFAGAGGPTSIISGPIALTAEAMTIAASENMVVYSFAEVSLSANTDYCASVKATGAGNIRFLQSTLISAGSRVFIGPSGTTMGGTTRNGGSGAFAALSSTTINPIAVRVSEITTSGGGGGGMLFVPNLSGT